MKGFKIFNNDWTCRGYQYKVGQTYEMDGEPQICSKGFHFCTKVTDCFNYYKFDPCNKIAEVEALGKVEESADDSKVCTNKIRIVREITWQELLAIANVGNGCTGYGNTGDRNTGYWNTGDRNTGDGNTGYGNTGDGNTGDWNTGYGNTGYGNTGDGNTGDWNTANHSNGCFNTEEQKIHLFNKPSNWTYQDWLGSDACRLMSRIDSNVLEYIDYSRMTDEEKEQYPTAKTTGGYLKELDASQNAKIWWEKLTKIEKDIIKAIPNFDPEIFREITGIEV